MSEHILTPPHVKRLERSNDGVLAGVCAGLGRYFDVTPTVFRLGFVVLTILGGAGILVYIAAILVIPKEGAEQSAAEDILRNRRDHPARLILLGLIAVAILSLLARADTWPTAGTAWALVAVAGVALFWTRAAARGILRVLLALVALVVVIAAAAVATAFAWFDVSLHDGVGNRSYLATGAVDRTYKLGIGDLHLDLSQVSSGYVDARLGIGELHIDVPQNATVTLESHVKAGAIDAFGRHDDGTEARIETPNGGALTVYAHVGAGHIEVDRVQ